jgi:hypothetical protein
MMDATRYFEHRLNETGYPNIEAMLSSITFIRQWLFLQKHYSHDLTKYVISQMASIVALPTYSQPCACVVSCRVHY